MIEDFRVETIRATVIPHPDGTGDYLCCGTEFSVDSDFAAHLVYRHAEVSVYTQRDMRNALVPLFLEAPS